MTKRVINIFALAIRHGLTTKDLKTTMFAYPTGACCEAAVRMHCFTSNLRTPR